MFALLGAAAEVAGNLRPLRIVRIDPTSTAADPNTRCSKPSCKPGTTTVDPLRSNDVRSAMSAVKVEACR